MTTEIGISWSPSTKSYRNGGITEIPEFFLRYDRETKTHRGPEHYFGIIRQSAGIAKWSELYERFYRLPGCWISSQGKFPRYQSTSVFPTTSDTGRDIEAFFRIAVPQRRVAKHLGHAWYIGKRFCKSSCIFVSSLSSRIESMEFINRRAAPFVHSGEKWKQEQYQDLRCQSGPSAKNSVIFSGGDSSKNHGADQQRLQISDLHFDKFPIFACWKIKFKTEVRTCSHILTEAMPWIKEMEFVDSVEELRFSCFSRGIQLPNFEVLDAKIARALNKIIHNSHFKRRITLEEQKAQKQDRFLSWQADCLPDLRLLPGH